VWVAKKIEQAIKMGKNEGSAKDSRTMMKDESTRWYNLDKRCDVMVGSSAISIKQL
jgi:hypothetical protein